MTPADLTALLAEPKVREARNLVDCTIRETGTAVHLPTGDTLLYGEALDRLVTAIAEAVEARHAPLVTAHAEWVAAETDFQALTLPINENDPKVRAVRMRLWNATRALYHLAPLTDRKETTG